MYFLKRKPFLCFRKLPIFQEVTFRARKSKTFPYKEAKFSKL